MKKELMIGIGAVATAGAIGGALLFFGDSATDGSKRMEEKQEQESQLSSEDRKKLEELNWDMWSDTGEYSFCFGEAEVNTHHTEPILGQVGMVKHTSRELLLFDKEAEKLFVLTREIKYSYNGNIKTMMGEVAINVPVSESGSLNEVYTKKDMPIRLDYSNKYVVTDPTTKTNMWVHSSINEEELVSPHIGCAGAYPLDNAPGKDLLAGSESVIIDRICDEKGVTGGYEGDFSFTCQAVDYRSAKEVYDVAREGEELAKDLDYDEALFDGEYFKEDSLEDALRDSKDSEDTRSESVQRALDELKNEMDASQSAGE